MSSSREMDDARSRVDGLFRDFDMGESLPNPAEKDGFLSTLVRRHICVRRLQRGRLSCSLQVHKENVNPYKTLHGGFLATAAEELARACAMTVVGEKDLFLGEGSASYLAAAKLDETVEADARIVRQGRRVIVSSVEFRSAEASLLYTYRATFYALPAARL